MNLAVSNYLLTLLTIKTIFISKTVYLFFVTLVLFVHQSSFLQNLLGLFIVDFRQVILKVVFLVILLDFDVLRSWVHAWDHRSQLSLEKDEMFHVAGNLISNRPFLCRKLKKCLLIIRLKIALLLRKNEIKQGHWKPRHQTATKKLDTKIRQKMRISFQLDPCIYSTLQNQTFQIFESCRSGNVHKLRAVSTFFLLANDWTSS